MHVFYGNGMDGVNSTKVRVLLTGYKLNGARATSVVEWGGTRQGIHSNPGLLQLILHDNQSVGVREDED